jgi:hypothetical protein
MGGIAREIIRFADLLRKRAVESPPRRALKNATNLKRPKNQRIMRFREFFRAENRLAPLSL